MRALSQSLVHTQQLFSAFMPGQILAPRVCTLVLFILQELQEYFTSMFTVIIVVCSMKRMCIPSFILVGCCVRELRSHLCPDYVWPGAVYCCFARSTLFTELPTCWFHHVL